MQSAVFVAVTATVGCFVVSALTEWASGERWSAMTNSVISISRMSAATPAVRLNACFSLYSGLSAHNFCSKSSRVSVRRAEMIGLL